MYSARRAPGLLGNVDWDLEYDHVEVYSGSNGTFHRFDIGFHYSDDCAGGGIACAAPIGTPTHPYLTSVDATDKLASSAGSTPTRLLRSFRYDFTSPGYYADSAPLTGANLPATNGTGLVAVDVNGDGLVDLFNGHQLWINNGTSPATFSYSDTTTTPQNAYFASLAAIPVLKPLGEFWPVSTWGQPTGWVIQDLDGDARPDIVLLNGANSGYALNNGNGWGAWVSTGALNAIYPCRTSTTFGAPWVASTCSLTGTTKEGSNVVDSGLRFVDVNGDGHVDILQSAGADGFTGGTAFQTAMVLVQNVDSSGNGLLTWRYDDALTEALVAFQSRPYRGGTDGGNWPRALVWDGQSTNIYAIDLNGDGRTDLVDFSMGVQNAYLATGAGWELSTSYTTSMVSNGILGPYDSPDLVIADYDGDGLLDLLYTAPIPLYPSTGHAFRNTGTGFVLDAWMDGLGGLPIGAGLPVLGSASAPALGWVSGDVDGDGRPDVLVLDSTSKTYQVYYAEHGHIGRLVAETNEAGGTQQITYTTTGTTYRANQSLGASYALPMAQMVVETITKCSAPSCVGSAFSSDTYTYSNGWSTSQGFFGFATVSSIHQPSGVTTVRQYPQFFEAERGMWAEIQTLRPDGSEARRQTQAIKIVSLSAGRMQPVVTSSTTVTSDVGATPVSHTVTTTVDTYGNLLATTDEGNDAVTGDEVTHTYVRFSSADGNRVDLVWSDQVNDAPGNIIGDTVYFYDGNSVGAQASVGLVTALQQQLNASNFATEHRTYDAAGRLTSVVDPDGITTTQTYPPTSLFNIPVFYDPFVAYQTSRGGIVERTTWADPLNRRAEIELDENGNQFTAQHGAFGKTTSLLAPGVASTLSTQFSIANMGIPAPASGAAASTAQCLTTTRPLDATRIMIHRECFDGFGRIYHVEDGDTSGLVAFSDSYYDADGRLLGTTLPYAPGAAYARSFVTYDALDRPTVVEEPSGTQVMTVYAGLLRGQTDEAGNVSWRTFDTSGRQLASEEFTGAASAATARTTQWTYSPMGNLTSITDGTGKASTFTYDMVGHVLTATDPDTGTTKFGLTTAGRVTSESRSSDGSVITYTLDALGRRIMQVSSDQTVTWTYGTNAATNSIGRVTQVTNGATTTNFTYDVRGNVLSRTLIVGTETLTATMEYLPSNILSAITYPDGVRVAYTYDSWGRVTNVASPTQVYLASATYDVANHVLTNAFGNGVSTVNTFSPTTGLPVTSAIGGGTLANISYYFDGMRRLIVETDTASGGIGTRNYVYDNVGELTSATGHFGAETYSYDAAGNLTSKGALNYAIDPNHPHRPMCVTSGVPLASGAACPAAAPATNFGVGPVVYDARGNVMTRSGETFVHDSLNRLVKTVTSAGNTTAIVYDALGDVASTTRPSSLTGAVETVYSLSNLYDVHSDYSLRHVVVNGRRIASEQVTSSTWKGTTTSTAAGFLIGGGLGLIALLRATRRWAAGLAPRFLRLSLALSRDALDGFFSAARTLRLRTPAVMLVTLGAMVTVLTINLRDAHAASPAKANTIEFYHADIVGSVSLATDMHGLLARQTEYRPFGEVYSDSRLGSDFEADGIGYQGANGVDYRATSDVAKGSVVTHMGARHYDATTGRFLEQDSLIPNAKDPRQLNRYAFVSNNPITFADPSGHGFLDCLLFGIGMVVAGAVIIGSGGSAAGLVCALAIGAYAAGTTACAIDVCVAQGYLSPSWSISPWRGLIEGFAGAAAAALALEMPVLFQNPGGMASGGDLIALIGATGAPVAIQGAVDAWLGHYGTSDNWFSETVLLFAATTVAAVAATSGMNGVVDHGTTEWGPTGVSVTGWAHSGSGDGYILFAYDNIHTAAGIGLTGQAIGQILGAGVAAGSIAGWNADVQANDQMTYGQPWMNKGGIVTGGML